VLLEFLDNLPPTIRHDVLDAIALAFEKRSQSVDEPSLSQAVREIIQPDEEWLMRQRVVLVAGLVDHLMNTIPVETLTEYWSETSQISNGSDAPVSRLNYLEVQARWYQLRAGPLSPVALLQFS
jgi:hypothetical protein